MMSPSAKPTHLFARLREPGSPTHVALLRIALGLHVLWVLRSPSMPLLMSIAPSLHPQSHILGGEAVFAALSPQIVGIARVVGIGAALCVVLGLLTRLSLLCLLMSFLITQLYWFGATLFHDDWIYFVFPMLALLSLTQPTAWSVDAFLRRGSILQDTQQREARFVVEAWVFWIGFVYAAAGIAKIFPLAKGIGWLSGRAAQEFAIQFVRESPAVAFLGQTLFPYEQQWMFAIGSVLTVAIELGALALWFTKKAYAPLALGIFALHVGIWFVGIPGFIGMFAVLALAILPSSLFAQLDAKETQLARRRAQPQA